MISAGSNKHGSSDGYTLIELLIVVSIVAVLAALSAPAFQDTIEAANTNSQIKIMLTTLNLARSEAIKRGQNVAICASDDGADCDEDAWSEGWIVFVDNNGDATGTAGSVDGGDLIIRVYDSLGAGSTMTFTDDILEYNSLGFSDNGGIETFLLCPSSNNALNARSIEVGASGRGRRIEDGLACP
ncbi:MAG: GspH/FimT family pseudopilin [Gammaproteobacteria bacterium]